MSNSWVLSLKKGDVLPSTPSAQCWGRGDQVCRSQVVHGGTQGVCGEAGEPAALPWAMLDSFILHHIPTSEETRDVHPV